MEFYISPQSGQFYMINVLENQWLSVTYKRVAWLGHYLDMERNMLYILQERILRLKTSVASTLYQIQRSNDRILPARFVASVVGQIISLQSVIGNIVRLKTRHLFKCINLSELEGSYLYF